MYINLINICISRTYHHVVNLNDPIGEMVIILRGKIERPNQSFYKFSRNQPDSQSLPFGIFGEWATEDMSFLSAKRLLKIVATFSPSVMSNLIFASLFLFYLFLLPFPLFLDEKETDFPANFQGLLIYIQFSWKRYQEIPFFLFFHLTPLSATQYIVISTTNYVTVLQNSFHSSTRNKKSAANFRRRSTDF